MEMHVSSMQSDVLESEEESKKNNNVGIAVKCLSIPPVALKPKHCKVTKKVNVHKRGTGTES